MANKHHMKDPTRPDEKRSGRAKRSRAAIMNAEGTVERKSTQSSGRSRKQAIEFGSGGRPHGGSVAEGGRPAGRHQGDRPVHSDVSGRAGAGGPAGGRLPAARAYGHGQDQDRGGAGRRPARQREEHPEGGLRRIPDGARGGQAHRRAPGLPGPPRDAAHADAAEAQLRHQRALRPFARALRRDRKGGAFAHAAAARRARQGHPAAGRQLHGELREEPGLPHQQPGRAGDDEGDQSRLRLPGGEGDQPRRPDQQAAEHRPGVGAEAVFAGVRQPHRLHHHLPAAHGRIAGHHSRPADHGPAEPRQYAAGLALLHAGGAVRSAAVPVEEGHQLRVRGAGAEPHHPPASDAAAGHAGGDRHR